MEIESITKINSEIVEFKNNEHRYMRYSKDNWEVEWGQSWEPLWDSDIVEAAYQKYLLGVTNIT